MEKKLSKIIFLFLLTFLGLNEVNSQCLNCNVKGIRTDPENTFSNSVNSEKPTKRNTFFDWTNLGLFPVSSQYWPAPYNNIESPFNQDGNSPLVHFLTNPDRLSKDGWELIKYDLGFNENGSPKGTPTRDIYIVLYNKYTGVLRVFVAVNESIAYNGVSVTIKFVGGVQSSLLSNASKIFALDQFEASPKITALTEYRPAKWMYADFHMTYDACSCYYNSSLVIEIKYLVNSNIALTGGITGQLTPTVNGSLTVSEDGYSLTDLVGAGKEAKKAYDDISKFTNDQLKVLQIDQKPDNQLTVEELAKKNALTIFQQAIRESSFLQAGLKAAPYIGTAIDLVDFFVGGGKKSSAPQEVKIMPMALQANVKLSGTINTQYPFPDITFYTPGSKDASCGNDSQYPYYNEVLGVFNLLETPKAYSTILESYHYYDQSGYYDDRERIVYQMAPLKYVINPASGLRSDNAEILASIDFGYFKTPFMPLSAINSFSMEVGQYSYDYGNGNTGYGILGCIPTGGPMSISLLINLQRVDSDANTQNVFMALKYPVTLTSQSLSSYNPYYCDFLNETTLSSQTIVNDANAWNKITIGPNVSFTGNRVLKANEIVVLPGATIPPNVTLQTGLPNGHIPSYVAPVIPTEIQTFCNGPLYNSALRNLRQRPVDEPQAEVVAEYQPMTIYPNPANETVTIQYFLETESMVSLKIFDVAGRDIASPLQEVQGPGLHELKHDVSTIAPGVYFYTCKTGHRTETKRIMIIR